MYSTFSKAGLWEVASRFGSSSEQIGLCLSVVKLHEFIDPKETPEEVASNFTCAMYDTPEEVLKCARHMVIFKMVEENPRDVGHEMDGLSIVYGDESLPRLYENSQISSEQLPSQQLGIVRRAVALGRFLQNPLAMVATLCGPRKEILSWKLTPWESFLNPDDKIGIVEQIMVDVTNQAGLDINLAISHEWLFAPLQFISGLGPRKAASLQRSLVRAGSIYTRKDFLTEHQLGKKVFVNAVGFLRVRRSGLAASSSQFIDLLDDTRIHPESYILAQELAKDVYDEDGTGDAYDDDDALEMAIEHVRDRPSYLKNLDVEEYASGNNRQDKIETLYDIKRELIQGFQDWRKQYEEPSPDEEFYMISGETEETLAEGKMVQVTVRRVQAQRAICGLESGMTGILMKEDYADDLRDIIELSDRLHEGDMLTCKIKSIQKNRYQVFLVCKESEMRSDRLHHNHNFDPYYHEDRSSLPNEQDKIRKERERSKKHFKPRMIVHPRFQNITTDEAIEFLSDKDPGESIFRPNSKGPSYLTLTLKIHDGVYAHKEIIEGGKELKDITSLLRIGKTLKIGEDTFEDLDEVMDRYVDPLVTHLRAMLNYRKFRTGLKTEVDELLKTEKEENPMRIVYSFGICHEHPGTFVLTYIRSTNPHHEYIGLYPKGFRFRKKMFEDIDRPVAYFQRHIDDPQNDSAPSIRSVAAMVPMRSPATGGSSGASVGSGWGGSNSEGGWRGPSYDRDRSSTPGSRTEIMGIEMNTLVDCLVHMVVVEGVVAVLIVIIVEDTTPTTKDVPVQPDGDLLEAFPGGWGGGASGGDKSGWGGGANGGDKSGWGGGASGGDKSGWGGGASGGDKSGWGAGPSDAEQGNSGWGTGSKKAGDNGCCSFSTDGSTKARRTLAIIKPDGLLGNYTDDIKRTISEYGFSIVKEQIVQLGEATVKRFYAEHSSKSFFSSLVKYMTSGPVLVMVLEKDNAVADWRALMGPTDASKAKITHPHSIRAKCGLDTEKNCVHGSDSTKSAQREILFFFDELAPGE
ncbi:Transcription elongation factor spt6, variant 2 [Lathyrus oleraceus]|uniref:Transcription elongation factor spt6, variant 2 n=1 Tax=Pisum sativum TaxID=3888 RepID=A0A9D5AZ36_PEA|nr:Transcription elongation factor spt6, variant 2 [Pisum sativum]